MASMNAERNALLEAYPPVSPTKTSAWAKRVAEMSDIQVLAIYNRLKNQGKIK